MWWPDDGGVYHWPAGVTREETVEAFVEMFESLGYKKCEGTIPVAAIHEFGFEKVAIYYTRIGNPDTLPGSPTHAALQTRNGIWMSKLGQHEDIEHMNLECLNGDDITGRTQTYGEPIRIMKRRRGLLGWLTKAFLRITHKKTET